MTVHKTDCAMRALFSLQCNIVQNTSDKNSIVNFCLVKILAVQF